MLLALLMFLLRTLFADDSVIDETHLKDYPFCGKMNFRNRNPIGGRVVNSKEASELYRWVVRIKRLNLQKDKAINMKTIFCSGSIITER